MRTENISLFCLSEADIVAYGAKSGTCNKKSVTGDDWKNMTGGGDVGSRSSR